LYVLYIIWMALLLFRIVEKVDAISVIGQGIIRLTANPLLQLLILAWVFSSFLQGVAGFGVPVAVVAPLLIGLGFDPVIAVAATAIGHSWSVTFGDIASSFNALIATSGLTGWELGPWAAIFLGITCLGCGLAICHVYDRWQGLKRGVVAIVLIGGSMALTQYVLATIGLWNLAGFVAGMVGLVVSIPVTRLPIYANHSQQNNGIEEKKGSMGITLAIMPYLILIVLVAAAELIGPVHHFLNQIKLTVPLPEISTGLGWTTPERVGKQISIFGHAGALLAYTSVLAFILFWRAGKLKLQDISNIVRRTAKSATPSSIGILAMVGMAMFMARSGMTNVLAQGISSAVGNVFPLVSPFIGLLGAFMTGSNTNSNVVFTVLQKNAAELVGASVLVVLAAQTTGGSLGSMIAPAKLIVGCSTAGLEGKEGQVLRITLTYGLLLTAVIGVLALLAA
ncbi:MAG: L-lactate permease, partial [Anaerolineales bacterium]|nr:L-lactate permease [Anaerolineales bacterium]